MSRLSKYVASFFRRSWTLPDYPVQVVNQGLFARPGSRWAAVPWRASIDGWPGMDGFGATAHAALSDLALHLERYRQAQHELPRPGVFVRPRFECAPQTEIEALAALASEYFPRVLGVAFEDCLVTDESSLWDFQDGPDNTPYHQATLQHFAVDISDITSGNLVAILQRIQRHRGAA